MAVNSMLNNIRSMGEAVECIRNARDRQMFQSAVASLREYMKGLGIGPQELLGSSMILGIVCGILTFAVPDVAPYIWIAVMILYAVIRRKKIFSPILIPATAPSTAAPSPQ